MNKVARFFSLGYPGRVPEEASRMGVRELRRRSAWATGAGLIAAAATLTCFVFLLRFSVNEETFVYDSPMAVGETYTKYSTHLSSESDATLDSLARVYAKLDRRLRAYEDSALRLRSITYDSLLVQVMRAQERGIRTKVDSIVGRAESYEATQILGRNIAIAIAAISLLVLIAAIAFCRSKPRFHDQWQDLVGYYLLVLGILARSFLIIPEVSAGEFHWWAAGPAMLIGLAIYPVAMRHISALKPRRGLEFVAIPFAFGFFLNLATVTVASWSVLK